MASWHRLERLYAQGERSVIPCWKSTRFRYFDFDEVASVLETEVMSSKLPERVESPLPPGFWGKLSELHQCRGRARDLPVIAKPQRPRMGTVDYLKRSESDRSLIDKETKEEILTITSPSSHHEDQNDSGIENRTADSHSPSTSLDFSPRSDSKLTSGPISPKTYNTTAETPASREQPPDYAPPPPPVSAEPQLGQVVIPLNVARPTAAVTLKPEDEDDDYPPPPLHLRRHVTPSFQDRGVHELSSHFESVSADFKAPLEHRFEENTHTTKQTGENTTESHSVDLTVELNREQRGQVTAIRYPATRKIETIPSPPPDDVQGATFISRISHHIEAPPPHSTAPRPAVAASQQQYSPQSRHRTTMPTTVYRTVDIPFDESPAAYQPKKDDKDVHTVLVKMGTHPVQKGLGFSITIERGRPTIDSVIISSPADRAGLLIGDRVISVNGEELKDKYPSVINRILHEAARLGEAEVCIERKDAKIAQVKSITSVENFDKARSVFVEKTVDSYAEFKKRHSRGSRADQPSPRDYNSLPRSTSSGTFTPRRDNSASGTRRKPCSPTRSYFEKTTTKTTRSEYKTQTNGPSADYRVTSLHEKCDPGKLTDFVPESERSATAKVDEEKKEFSYRRVSDDEPRLIRNYDLPPATTTSTVTRMTPTTTSSSPLPASRRSAETTVDSVTAVPKRSTLPRNTHVHVESRDQDDDTVAGRSYLRKTLRQTLSPSPPVGILRRYPEFDDSVPFSTVSSEEKSYSRNYRSGEDSWKCTYPHQRSRSSYELRDRGERDRLYGDSYGEREIIVQEDYELEEMYRKQTRDFAPQRTTIVPIRRIDTAVKSDEYRQMHAPRPYHTSRSKSSDFILEQEHDYRRHYDDVRSSDSRWRYDDRDGRRAYNVDIRRDYDRGFSRDAADRQSLRDTVRLTPRTSKSVERRVEERIEYEEMEKRMWVPERRVLETRDWRDLISQQRQAAPGRTADTQRIRDASASLSYLPAIINRKLEETRKLEKERQSAEHAYRSYDIRREPLPQTDSYERDYSRFEKSYTPEYRGRGYDSLRYGATDTRSGAIGDSAFTSDYRHREQRDLSPSEGYGRREMRAAVHEEVHREALNNEQVVAVSGKHRCAHCSEELGRGAAMIIESLNLFYHLACFKCYVCKTPLGPSCLCGRISRERLRGSGRDTTVKIWRHWS